MIGGDRSFTWDGRRIWCGVVGEPGGRPPLVCVPGGPGASHDYLIGLAALARGGRQVVFYDALGSGRSERPDGARWTQEVYVDEIAAVVTALGLERYHLFAASAGGLAAFPYALRQPPGLLSLVLAGTPANIADHNRHTAKLLVALGVLPERLGAFDSTPTLHADDARILLKLAGRYICRVRPMPSVLLRIPELMNTAANVALKGGRVFYTSALRDWDVSDRLGEIAVPALFTCGRDELLPMEACQDIRRRLRDCQLAIFERSGHVAHLDEPENYIARVGEFLARVD